MGRDVYGSDWLKAAALLETIVRLKPLADHNTTFAWTAAEMFLVINGHRLKWKPDDAATLVAESECGIINVVQTAARLRAWTATSP